MTAARAGAEYLDRDQFEALVIGSGFGGVDVHEDVRLAEALHEPVIQPTGEATRLLPPIADKDAT